MSVQNSLVELHIYVLWNCWGKNYLECSLNVILPCWANITSESHSTPLFFPPEQIDICTKLGRQFKRMKRTLTRSSSELSSKSSYASKSIVPLLRTHTQDQVRNENGCEGGPRKLLWLPPWDWSVCSQPHLRDGWLCSPLNWGTVNNRIPCSSQNNFHQLFNF